MKNNYKLRIFGNLTLRRRQDMRVSCLYKYNLRKTISGLEFCNSDKKPHQC